MNKALATFCEVLLLLLVPAIVTLRFFVPKRLPWWALTLLVASVSWVLVNLTVYFSQAHITDLVMQAGGFDRAPQSLLDDWAIDGGPKTFAFLFGWVPGLAILVPCIATYGLAQFMLERRANAGALPSNKSLERTREG
jgi:hypothetical protein